MIIPNIWENKKWQPNHQPEHSFFAFSIHTWPLVVVEVQHVTNGSIGDGRGEDRNVVASVVKWEKPRW